MSPSTRRPPAQPPPPVALDLARLLLRLQRLDNKASQLLNAILRSRQP